MVEQANDPQVSSTLIFDQLRLLREVYGEGVVRDALSSLPPELERELSSLMPGGWCSLDAPRALKDAVAAAVGETSLGLQRRIVRLGVERTFSTVWRFVLRHLSDDGLTKRTPLIYSRTFNRGSMELVGARPKEGEFELRGWPRIPDYDLVGLTAGTEAVLELAGRAQARIVTTRRANVVRLVATWR